MLGRSVEPAAEQFRTLVATAATSDCALLRAALVRRCARASGVPPAPPPRPQLLEVCRSCLIEPTCSPQPSGLRLCLLRLAALLWGSWPWCGP